MIISNKKRELLASAFFDLANLALGALVLSQFLSSQPLNTPLIVIGILIAVLVYTWAVIIAPHG